MVPIGLVHVFEIEEHQPELIIDDHLPLDIIKPPRILNGLFQKYDTKIVVPIPQGTLEQSKICLDLLPVLACQVAEFFHLFEREEGVGEVVEVEVTVGNHLHRFNQKIDVVNENGEVDIVTKH